MICAVDAYNREHVTMLDVTCIGGGRKMPSMSPIEMLISIVHTMNFIINWLGLFEVNYDNRINIYKIKISESFKTIPKSLSPKNLMIIKKY